MGMENTGTLTIAKLYDQDGDSLTSKGLTLVVGGLA